MDHTNHTLLVGDQATQFAISMGFEETSLTSKKSKAIYQQWKQDQCQPNYWVNVLPDPGKQCGPYHPKASLNFTQSRSVPPKSNKLNHDTIGMIVIDGNGHISAGTTTNGLNHKIPG